MDYFTRLGTLTVKGISDIRVVMVLHYPNYSICVHMILFR
jgi:hypothetical protein